MAEAAIVFFLSRLSSLLLQEGDHLSKIQEHVEWIQKELQTMVAFLKDADRRQQRDELVATWVREVRNLVYDAEDIIDEYVTQMDALHWYTFSVFKYFYVRHHVCNQIIKIRKEVIEVNARKDRYGFRGVPDEAPAAPPSSHGVIGGMSYRGPGAASPFVQVEDIVGIEDDVEQLVKMLLEGNRHGRLVISVFGMGGLGKTTLVKEVFKKAKMKFDCHSWVFVSQSCTLIDALKSILFGFMESRGEPAIDVMDAKDEGRLQGRTYNYLQDKKFLLVLDDIWDNRLWDDIKHSLPPKRGRIIFTTRMRNIASPGEENFQIYDLQPLPYELAWQIFCKKAFRAKRTCPEDIKEFAEAIVRRCGGLPLAVVAIGGVLANRGTNLPAWQSVLHTLDWEMSQHRDLERLNNALLFSYNYLPFYLKHCFLHVGLFPEDYNIARKRLIRMWIAEGFLQEIPGKTLEEVANHYFMQLIDRSMIQAVTLHARDVVKACKVHDLMRDIANHMLKEEKFGAVLGGGESIIIQERQRRLAIYDNSDHIPPDISKLNLRSLLMFRVNEVSSSVLQKLLVQLKLAKVLDLQGVPLEKLPDEIGQLIHLRYLGLRGSWIQNLPKSLKNLRNLQTLDIRKTNVRCLPAGSNKLQQLRHLLLSSFRDREKGFVKLSQGRISFLSLQTLSGVEADDELLKELKGLKCLRKLSIRGITEANSKQLCDSLEEMTNLRSLTIVSESPAEQDIHIESLSQSVRYLEKLKLQVHMMRFPEWFNSLGCLHTLYLFKNFTREDPFPVLGNLPNLVILTLASAFSCKDIKCSSRGFPKLKLLRILDIANWATWQPIQDGTLPKLQYLLIADCPNLIKLPDGFNHLTALQDLTLAGTSAQFSYRIQGVDRWKVNHVREVSIISQVNGKFVKQKL